MLNPSNREPPPIKLLPVVTAENYTKLLDLALQLTRNEAKLLLSFTDLEQRMATAMSDLSKSVLAGLDGLQSSVNDLSTRVGSLPTSSGDTADTVSDLNSMNDKIAAIKSIVDGVAANPAPGIVVTPAPSSSTSAPQTSADSLVSQ